MSSVATLESTIKQQESDLESKRKLADELFRSADAHDARGDDVKAKMDRESAERYLADAESIGRTITEYQTDIQRREQEAAEIDRQIDALRQRFERDMSSLEDDKQSVMTALLVNDSLGQASVRAVKNKELSNKEEQLKKDYDREFSKLEQKKKLILG